MGAINKNQRQEKSNNIGQKNDPHLSLSEISVDQGLARLYNIADNWFELESDPGLFTLLIQDFGCLGVEVEEIYDLQSSFSDDVYGFIFLFNTVEDNRRSGALTSYLSSSSASMLKTSPQPSCLLSGNYLDDEAFYKKIFFAYQKVPNSCATHAILSILLNNPQVNIGSTLKRLKEYTKGMSPEDKGFAISNMPELARAHNAHASNLAIKELEDQDLKPKSNSARVLQRANNGLCSGEAFHFVSFVPIDGRLIELDGLREYPIDHGLIEAENETWTEMFRRLIRARIETPRDDIRYNLMQVIPNKYHLNKRHLACLERNRRWLFKLWRHLDFQINRNIYEHSYFKKSLDHPFFEKNNDDESWDDLQNYRLIFKQNDSEKTKNEKNILENKNDEQTNNSSETDIAFSDLSSDMNFEIDGRTLKFDHEVFFLENELDDFEKCNQQYVNQNETKQEKREDQESCKHKNIQIKLLFVGNENTEDISVFGDGSSERRKRESMEMSGSRPDLRYKISDSCKKFKSIEMDDSWKFSLQNNLDKLLVSLTSDLARWRKATEDERKKLEKYELDDSRRIHDYDELIVTFLSMIADQGLLEDFLKQEYSNSNISYYPLSVTTPPSVSNANYDGEEGSEEEQSKKNSSSKESMKLKIKNKNRFINSKIDQFEEDEDGDGRTHRSISSSSSFSFNDDDEDSSDIDFNEPMLNSRIGGFFPIDNSKIEKPINENNN